MLRPRSRRRPPSPRPRAASEESLQGALGLAFRYLGRCDRTVAEMREHLGLRGVDEPTIERVLATLARSGYLDDTRYARRYAEDRRQLDGWGSERIEGGLLRVGIDPELAAEAAAPNARDEELGAALALLERRFAAGLADDRERVRALGVLVRRGYELGLAHEAIRRHEREVQSG